MTHNKALRLPLTGDNIFAIRKRVAPLGAKEKTADNAMQSQRPSKRKPGVNGANTAARSPSEAGLSATANRDLPPASTNLLDGSKPSRPLRVKVPKSKERALIREFGLDVTALTAQEVERRRDDMKALLKMGKSRGFLTHQEISDHLPEKLVDAEVLEATVRMLNDMGIAVYEQAPDAATLLVNGGTAAAATEDEAEEAAEAAVATVDSEFGRTTDPVRMYMREMSSFELLTREGEIEIAKRIESGLQAMMSAVSAFPPVMLELLSSEARIASRELAIS